MQQCAVLTYARANGGDVVQGAQFVIHQHQGDQESVVTQRFTDGFGTDQPIGVRHQVGHGHAALLQLSRGVQGGLVFNLAGDDVPARNAARLGDTLDSEVVGFSRARSPHNLFRLGAHQLGHLQPCQFNRLPGRLAKRMGTGRGVTKIGVEAQALDHYLDDPLIRRGGGGIVEIQRTFIHDVKTRRAGSREQRLRGIDQKQRSSGLPDRMPLKKDHFM